MDPARGAADAPGGEEAWVVACLCARWCTVCRSWQGEFVRLARDCGTLFGQARWLWVDVEEQADELGDFEPENFPVLAVQRGDELLYCATLPQQAGNWKRLLHTLRALQPAQLREWAQALRPLDLDLRRLHDDAQAR